MARLTLHALIIVALLLGGCGESERRSAGKEPRAPFAHPEVPDAVSPRTSTKPEDVLRLWLDAAKLGDAEAMSALWAEEKRPAVKANPKSFTGRVASGTLRAASWRLGSVAGEGEERTVTAHVVWREYPSGGDNLEFRFVQRDGRWWMVSLVHYD